jgi:hypothetical protein
VKQNPAANIHQKANDFPEQKRQLESEKHLHNSWYTLGTPGVCNGSEQFVIIFDEQAAPLLDFHLLSRRKLGNIV